LPIIVVHLLPTKMTGITGQNMKEPVDRPINAGLGLVSGQLSPVTLVQRYVLSYEELK